MPSDEPASRRSLLGKLALGTGVCAAGASALPFAAALLEPARAPLERPEVPFLDVAAERDVRAGAPLRVNLRAPVRDGFFTVLEEVGSAWLLFDPAPGGALRALSAACPHLGCAVAADAKGFACPCHDSRFSPEGAFLRGPSPRSLDPLPVRVEAGRVLVQPLRFAAGTRERRAL